MKMDMYINRNGIKDFEKNSHIICETCRYNCKYGGSDYCIRYHHFITVNTIQRNYCKEYAKRVVYRHRVLVV